MNNEKLIRLPKEVERIDLEKTTFMEDSTSNIELPMVDEKLELVNEQYNEIASNKIPQLQGQMDNMEKKGVETVLGKKGILQASVIRNVGDGWKFINGDNVHDEINFSNVSVEGNRIRLDNKPVKLIGSTVVTPDDTLAGYGLTCGASVGTEKSYINCYAPFGGVLDGTGVLTINSWFYDTFTVTKLADGTGFEILYDGNSNVKEPVLATTVRSGSTQHSGLEIFASRDAYNKATFRAYNDLYGHVGFDGTNWNVSTSCVANISAEWNKYNDSTLVILHDTVPPISGYNAFQSVNINMRTPVTGNLIHGRIERVNQTEIRIAFYNNDGTKIITPSTDMRLFFSIPGFKVPHIWNTYCRANVWLGQTIVRPDKLVHANGNLWVLGLNQSY